MKCAPETTREGADDLTLRAEEVKTVKACSNIDHVEENRWGPPLVDADWHAFCLANREMSKATGAKKLSESQKAKALWAMKAAEDSGEEFCDPARKDIILRRQQTRLELWEEHSRTQS